MRELRAEIERLEASITLFNSLVGVNDRCDATFIQHRNWHNDILSGLKQQYGNAQRP
jgi:hypothetical protein